MSAWLPGRAWAGQLVVILLSSMSVRSAVACSSDVDDNGVVDIDDLVWVIIEFGTCPPGVLPTTDVNQSGCVDIDDVVEVVIDWGPCPTDNDPDDALIFWSENCHWYEAVLVREEISWVCAQSDAQSRGGYLATLTSDAENAFVFSNVAFPTLWPPGARGPWIGAFRPDLTRNCVPAQIACAGGPPAEPWAWVTSEQWDFEAWAVNEPSSGDCESFAHLHALPKGDPAPIWNNLDNVGGAVFGYVVEYETFPD